MATLFPGLLGVISRPPDSFLLQPQMAGQGFGGPAVAAMVSQAVAVAVVVIAALLISRLHRKVLSQCQQLQGQMSRAEDAQVKLQTLLVDLMATLNLSLASLAKGRDEVDERQIESIRAAVQKAIEGATTVGTRSG